MKMTIENLDCLCSLVERRDRIAYVLYPMDTLEAWVDRTAREYDTNIVAISGMEWSDELSPWQAKGVPKGCPDFKGEAPEFLNQLRTKVFPEIESRMGMEADITRTLIGVSMSGLFALWQWMLCDTFANISSISGSFWYENFVNWMETVRIPSKTGKAYFLLGDQEAHTRVKTFRSVASDTQTIVSLLRENGINTEFESVPGDHYSDPIRRLDKAFKAIYER